MDYTNIEVKEAAAVVQSFMTVSKTLTKLASQNATSLGLTLLQMGILNTISSSPDLTVKQVTDKLQLPKSTVSTNIDDLVNLDLLERKTSEQDRREVCLRATAKGKDLAKRSAQNAPSYKAMLFALEKLPEEDVQALTRMHKEILHHLQAFSS